MGEAEGYGWERLLLGEAAPGLPVFCLERWQSLNETREGVVVLSESGVEPPSMEELEEMGVDPSVMLRAGLGYGWTKGLPALRERIAGTVYHGVVSGEEVVVTAGGGAEANLVALLALVAPGDTVVVDMPGYMQARGLLERLGARVVEAWRSPGDGWRLPVDRLVELIEGLRPRLVYVINPNNPTGAVAGRRELLEVAGAAARRGTVLVFDEVYRGLEHGEAREAPSILEAALEAGAEAVSVGSLSKAAGLPGLRVGWLAATSRGLADRLWSVKDYTSIAAAKPSEALAAEALREDVYHRLTARARRIASRNLALLEDRLRRLEGRVRLHRPRAGAFALLELPLPGTRVAEELLRRHMLLVNPGECFRVPRSLRVGLGTASEGEAAEAYEKLARELQGLLEARGEG